MQNSGSVCADRIGKFRNTNFELERKEIEECFLNVNGIYTSNLVAFQKNLCKQANFWSPKELYKSLDSATDIVITHSMNPIVIKNAIPNKIVPNVRQTHATHS